MKKSPFLGKCIWHPRINRIKKLKSIYDRRSVFPLFANTGKIFNLIMFNKFTMKQEQNLM